MITIFTIVSYCQKILKLFALLKKNLNQEVCPQTNRILSHRSVKVVKIRQFEDHLGMIALKRDAGFSRDKNNKRGVGYKALKRLFKLLFHKQCDHLAMIALMLDSRLTE